MPEESKFLIDVDRVLREKAPRQYPYVPRFVVNYLKRIVHQDELNVFLREHGDEEGMPFLKHCLEFLGVDLVVNGEENLPPVGSRSTFVSNHPLGGQDGLSLAYTIGRHYDGKVKYLVNDLLMNIHGLTPFFVPINKTGSQSRDFPQKVETAFASDAQLIMFPAGLCSRKHGGVIRDLEWKKSFVQKSVQYRRDIIPIYFDGQNSNAFYRIANVCDMFRNRINIAMLYLADEMMKNRGKTFTITIGRPLPWQTFDKSRTYAQWAQYVKDIVYNLNMRK